MSAYVNQTVEFTFRQPSTKAIEEARKRGEPLPIKRQPVKLSVPLITFEGLAELLNSGDDKIRCFVLNTINSTIVDFVQSKFDAFPRHMEIDVSQIDMSDVSLETIANLPEDERKARAIPDEVWEAWEKDYMSVMLTITDRGEAKIRTHIKLLRARFNPVKANKPVIEGLANFLEQWWNATQEGDKFEQIYRTLANKAQKLLNADDSAELDLI